MLDRYEAMDVILDRIHFRINFPASLVAAASDGTQRGYLNLEDFVLSKNYRVLTVGGKLTYLAR